MGMTNEQFKAVLMDELEDWQDVLQLLKDAEVEQAIRKVEQQIEKTNAKLKL